MTAGSALDSAPIDVQEDVARGVEVLKAGGCSQVYVLGSVAEGRSHPESDIDFAVRGCPPDRFFKLQGRLLMELTRSADLIDLDVDPDLAAFSGARGEIGPCWIALPALTSSGNSNG